MTLQPVSYKVVLVFNLRPGTASEELRRSQESDSFPLMLSRQPGLLGMELVRASDDQTMSIQTWDSSTAWFAALNAVKDRRAGGRQAQREEILVERAFFGVDVAATIPPPKPG